jgi:hypothetical protein
MVFENGVLRIFRPERDKVTGELRKLQSEELHDLYSSLSIVQVIKLTLSARPPFQNFSTSCILNVNNTGAKQGSIMK